MSEPVTGDVGARPQIVVGHDRHPAAATLLAAAAGLAARLGAELQVVHAVDLADYPVDPDAADWEEQARQTLDEERRRVTEVLADHDVPFAYRACRGNVVDVLAEAAAETGALMIVVGGGGSRLARWVDPSVVHGLIGRQRTPVLVVPVDGHSDA